MFMGSSFMLFSCIWLLSECMWDFRTSAFVVTTYFFNILFSLMMFCVSVLFLVRINNF